MLIKIGEKKINEQNADLYGKAIVMPSSFKYSNENVNFPEALYILNRTRKTCIEGKNPYKSLNK